MADVRGTARRLRGGVGAGIRVVVGAGLMMALGGLSSGPATAASHRSSGARGGVPSQARSHSRGRHAARPTRRRHRPTPARPPVHSTSGPTPALPGAPATCPGAEAEPGAASPAAIAQATLCLVNRARAAVGLAPLIERMALDRAAAHHSDDMVSGNYFDHVSPAGETLADRVLATGYVPPGSGWVLAENLACAAVGAASPAAIVAAWMGDPLHRANILDPSYRDTGMGVAAAMPATLGGGLAGATYTQEFGAVGDGG